MSAKEARNKFAPPLSKKQLTQPVLKKIQPKVGRQT